MLKNKVIAVTGSSGFIGHLLVDKLKKQEADVVELDFKKGVDISDWRQLEKTKKFDVLIHLAAKTFVPDSFRSPRLFYTTNFNSTLNALELCRKHNARMVFASSFVYGFPQYLPIDENHPVSAFNPYSRSKIIGEQLCRSYHEDYGMNVVILRAFNIYGPGQDERFLIASIVRQLRSGKINLKDPNPKRDFVHISDVVDAYIKASKYAEKKFDIFNIASGESRSVKEISNLIVNEFEGNVRLTYSYEQRKNEVMDTIADVSKAKKYLKWEPKIDFVSGIRSMIEESNC